MDIPALPFCTATLTAAWRPAPYPNEIKHLGDHIRRRRLELDLLQKDVAEKIGTHVQTVCNWERSDTSPALSWLPGIIRFLGYDPRPMPQEIGQRLRHHRQRRGQSQKELAAVLGIDPSILSWWERGEREPTGELRNRVDNVLNCHARPDEK